MERKWLEVLKFLEPFELLHAESVCHVWRHWCSSDEVWAGHLVESPLPDMSYKESCHRQLQPCFLAHIDESFLTIIDVRTLEAKCVRLSEPFIRTSFGAWVSVPRRVLYCGGVPLGGRYTSTSFLIDIASFQAQKLPNMHTARAGGGLVYYQGNVYVFGGDNDQRQGRPYGDLHACEKYSLAGGNWTRLPDMSSPRRSFTPFRHQEKIYIAGGGGANNQVEVFDVITEKFLPSPYTIPFSDRLASCLVLKNQLAVLSASELTIHDLKTGAQVGQAKLPSGSYWYSPGGTVTWKGKIFFATYYESDLLVIDSTWEVSEVATHRGAE